MVPETSVLVALILLIDRLPEPWPGKRGRGRPRTYSDRLFLKARVILEISLTSSCPSEASPVGAPPVHENG